MGVLSQRAGTGRRVAGRHHAAWARGEMRRHFSPTPAWERTSGRSAAHARRADGVRRVRRLGPQSGRACVTHAERGHEGHVSEDHPAKSGAPDHLVLVRQ